MRSSTQEIISPRDRDTPLQMGHIAPNFSLEVEGDFFNFYDYIEDGYGLLVSLDSSDLLDLISLSEIAPEFLKRNTKIIGKIFLPFIFILLIKYNIINSGNPSICRNHDQEIGKRIQG